MNTLAKQRLSSAEVAWSLRDIDTLCVDLWGTVARSDNREPIKDTQRILGYKLDSLDDNDITSVDESFLNVCLTTDEKDPEPFLFSVAKRFSLSVDDRMVEDFEKVIHEEAVCSGIFFDAKTAMKALSLRGFKMVLVSNLWPFPVECLFAEDNLGKYFPEQYRVYSFREGVSKPDPELFRRVHGRAGSSPERCLMIGDSLENDIIPAMAIGMKTCLIDRKGVYSDDVIPQGVLVIRSMEALLEILPGVNRA